MTEFIARKKSRQEIVPLVGKFIDKAHVEPLHLKNNAWQYFFRSLLKEAIGKSNLPPACKSFVEVPKNSCFARLVTTLQNEVKAKRLTRKVKKWFDETEGKKGDLQYRFTGKTSRLFCHNFITLVKSLSQEEDSQKQKQTILVLSYIGLRLRDCCSIFNDLKPNKQTLPSFLLWHKNTIVPIHCFNHHQLIQLFGQLDMLSPCMHNLCLTHMGRGC